ncbi:hypothetical protein Q5P01_001817 [Channa striata]|uniref:Uncharacterized protein n=1 Tax=Channa striata TaxID=64152 RepID=A0AA88NT80_CHASR|nr:hypothetical protein Q5P01_001817 [Channa striata]
MHNVIPCFRSVYYTKMEFWPENQDHLPLYAKFGTVPGRNCTHEYHDRHQAPHYPLYYGEQQDHGRESCYWTVPGSRTGGTLQEYNPWTDPDLPSPPSSYFPFIQEHHTQQHQDRDREWTASQRTREYEKRFLREGWQSRWEPCSPVHYNREVSTKRSDGIYRELEAWAARYSHTLPRRRRVEAELRGASQGLPSERDGQSGTDPRVAALQQVRQSANIRESGVWNRGDRLQTPTYYPPQAPAPDTSHMVDIKGKTGYQRRMFSHPPGYIAPPPYNNQHKSSPVTHHCDTNWEEQGKRQTYLSQPALTKQNVPVELQNSRKRETENVTNRDENKTCPELEEIMHRRQKTGNLHSGSPVSVGNVHTQHQTMLLLEQPQMEQVDQSTKTNKQTSSKIIEGRKFRLNKKTGRMTIFCLVSRIAGVTETPSLPLCISQTNTENPVVEGVSKCSPDASNNQMSQADEVDFRVPILTEPSDKVLSNLRDKERETSPLIKSEMPEDNLSNNETTNVFPGKTHLTDVNSTFGKQSILSLKYPLWKEPSLTSRPETGSSSSCSFKLHSEEKESDGLHSQEGCAKAHPINSEVQRLDTKEDTESEDNKGLLVIDTSCVVVKMELIPSPKKEKVQVFSYAAQSEDSDNEIQTTTSPQPNILHVTTDQNAETKSFQINDKSAIDPHSALTEKRSTKYESEVSSPCIPSSSVPETLEERAERILGIPLYDCLAELQPGAAMSLPDLHVEEGEDEIKHDLLKNYLHDPVGQISGDPSEKKGTKTDLEVGQTEDALCFKDSDDFKDQPENEECEDFVGTEEQKSEVSKENNSDLQLEMDINMSKEIKMTKNDPFETTSEDGKTEHKEGENPPAENDPSSRPLSPPKDQKNLTTFPCISEANTEGNPEPNTAENLSAHSETSYFPETTPDQMPPPLPPGSIEPFPTFSSHTDLSPNPPLLNLTCQTSEAASSSSLCTMDLDRPAENENFAKDMTKELMSLQQSESDRLEIPVSLEQRDVTPEEQMKQAHPVDPLVQTLEIPEQTEAEQTQNEIGSPAELYETTISQDNMTDSHKQLEVNTMQKGFDNGKEEDVSCFKATSLTEEQSHIDADDAGLLEVNKPYFHAHTEFEMLQDTKPQTDASGLNCEVSPSPLDVLSPSKTPPYMSPKSETQPVSLLETDVVCPSELNPDTGISETTTAPIYLGSIEESLPSLLPFQSTSNLASSCSPPSHEGGESVSLDLPHKEESQYPKSLWDAVHRIRRHTAPDSENDEEEVSELWDPESLGQDLGFPDVGVDFDSRKVVFDKAAQFSTEERLREVEVEPIQQDTCHEEPSERAEDDTLSCSSTSSHSSGDTVIVAEDDEAEVTTLDDKTYSKTETNEEEEGSCLSEEFKGEVENVPVEDVEITELNVAVPDEVTG